MAPEISKGEGKTKRLSLLVGEVIYLPQKTWLSVNFKVHAPCEITFVRLRTAYCAGLQFPERTPVNVRGVELCLCKIGARPQIIVALSNDVDLC